LALTSDDKLILSVVLVVLMTLVVYYELRVMRGKAKEIRAANQRKDEAYNAVLTTRSVMDVVERDGADVGNARAMLNRARDAMARGNFDRATDLCESAKAELMKCRRPRQRQVRKVDATEEVADDLELLAEEIVGSDARPSQDSTYKGTKLPIDGGSGHLTAKFELTAAKDEIGRAVDQGKDIKKAKSLLRMAESEFEAANYPKALSLAVKARKELDEAAADIVPLRPAPKVPLAGECVEDVAYMPEEQAAKLKCDSCSSMVLPDDVFCGHCGAPAVKERTCSKCGKRSDGKDRFCRKCGTEL
jgi:cellobiose-specific phosphotransferase system component IIA